MLYHVYAAKANDVWKRNLRQLARRWRVFTGRKLIAVAMGPETEDLAAVRGYLESLVHDKSVEWLPFVNDPEKREAATFPRLLQAVKSTAPMESFFFAHTKGVSPYGNNPQPGITYWRNAMYRHLLDDPRKIDALLKGWPCVGACKIIWRKDGETTPSRSWLADRGQGPSPYPSGLFWGAWMFAGTYFWVRSQALFSNWRWPFIPDDHYGVEAYLSGIFPASKACSVYQPWPEDELPEGSPYDPRHHWERIEDVPEPNPTAVPARPPQRIPPADRRPGAEDSR